MAVRKILVATDFSNTADAALDSAIELAGPANAEIVLLHVVQPVVVAAAPEARGASAAVADLLSEQESLGKRKLEQMAAALRKRGVGVQISIRRGSAHSVIVAAAESLGADLIVVGSQGRSGLSHLLLGSVAEKVVRLAACPVLTVSARTKRRKPGRRASAGKR